MNLEQIRMLKESYMMESTKPNGKKSTLGEYMRFCLDGNIDFVTSKDLVVFDDEHTMLHCVCINDDLKGQADFPIKVISSDYAIVQQVESVMSVDNFNKFLDSGYLSGMISDKKKEFMKKFARSINNFAIQPMEAEPYYSETAKILPMNTSVIPRDDGVTNPVPTVSSTEIVKRGTVAALPITNLDEYKEQVSNFAGKDVYLKINKQTFDAGLDLPNAQNDENPPKLHLALVDCTFDGYGSDGKQVYIPNAQELVIDGCIFMDGAAGNYAVDVNLCTIQDANITIKNSEFFGENLKSAIRVSARMGETDHPTDITATTAATIKLLTVDNCVFYEGNDADLTIGTTPEGADTEANTSTGAFPVVVKCLTEVTIKEPYMVGKDVEVPAYTAAPGSYISKASNNSFYGQFVIGAAVEGEPDVIVMSEEGAEAAIASAEENAVIFIDPSVTIDTPLTLDKSVSLVSNGASITKPIVFNGEYTSISGFLISAYDPDAGDGKGKSIIKTTSDIFTMNDNTIIANSKSYNMVNLACTGMVAIIGNTFSSTDASNVHNVIEFSQDAAKKVTNVIIEGNEFKKGCCDNNNISFFQFVDNAVVSIKDNHFEMSANAVRLSNYSSAQNVLISCDSNTYDETVDGEYAGFLLLQGIPKYQDDFSTMRIIFTNLIGPGGKFMTENGTGLDQVWYTYQAINEPIVTFLLRT